MKQKSTPIYIKYMVKDIKNAAVLVLHHLKNYELPDDPFLQQQELLAIMKLENLLGRVIEIKPS